MLGLLVVTIGVTADGGCAKNTRKMLEICAERLARSMISLSKIHCSAGKMVTGMKTIRFFKMKKWNFVLKQLQAVHPAFI